MNIVVLSCSPKKDGLTAACASAAWQGIADGKGTAEVIRLNDLKISKCQACNDGWGSCAKGACQVQDDFQALHDRMREADGFVVVTPVYWWEMSESLKSFFDRLRRCEAMKPANKVCGKPFICVAAAGGTGNGTISCLASMEKVFLHLNNAQYLDFASATRDLIGVTQKNKSYMLQAIRAAAEKMAVSGAEKGA